MQRFSFKTHLAMTASSVLIAGLMATPSFAQSNDGLNPVEDEIISTGTRRQARSAADLVAPVDVIGGDELLNQASNDVSDLIRIAVPSYNVNTQPISDAATIVRPANLRGLSPDNTLVLVNGKRRHRASVISFLGGGIADGAHGPDISVFPSLGLKQVEVLRDGASSQYGSDAIAGVINFQLNDAREGGTVEVKYGSTYAGDGDNYRISGNFGLPLGDNGFINITGEYGEVDDTDRSVARDDVLALFAAGNTDITDISVNTVSTDLESVQIWGQPNVNDDIKLFVNSAYEFNENAEIYAFGNYAERQVEGGFFFRNPTNRGGVFAGPTVDPVTGAASSAADAVASVLVGNLAGIDPAACPAGIPLTGTNGLIPDATVLAQVVADDNCFSFVETLPGGFVPRFGGDNQDFSIVAGLRGELEIGNGLGYDISYTYGNNQTDFFINNTVNASLGPNTPRNFFPGAYEQTDNNFNLDLTYGIPISGWASDLNIAAGFEYREETFTITQGDDASFAIGPLSQPSAGFPTGQGFASSSNGFGGFVPAAAGEFSQDNIAFYGDIEADVTEAFTLQAAGRWEDFNTFGSTFDWKVGGLYRVNDNLTVRGTYSTGFHAPTTGQANVTNITTAFVGGILADVGTLPITTAAGQFINDQRAARGEDPFTLNPEESENISIGLAATLGNVSITLDYFNITLDGRIATTSNIDFQGELLTFAAANGVDTSALTQTSQIINALDGVAGFSAADFAGSEDLTSFVVFTNNFDTKTQGIDLVANMPLDFGVGTSSVTLAANWTDTDLTNVGRFAPLGPLRQRSLQENIPDFKGNLTFQHEQGPLRGLVRANYHSSFFEDHLGNEGFPVELGSEINFDAEITYSFLEGAEISVGAANIFDNFPDDLSEIPLAGFSSVGAVAGARYPSTAPFGFNGGQWYVRARYSF